ncbi:MAG: hypothetical protein ACE5R4_02505 [Armatimonadota bacterium]
MTGRAAVLILAASVVALALAWYAGPWAAPADGQARGKRGTAIADGHALKVITLNTGAYAVEGTDRRSVSIVAEEDMHIVGLSHFIGVQAGTIPSDNGHILSTLPDNPWEKWAEAGTGMEPTGTKGYFGYCGRDYYSECAGIGDILWHENMPPGCHFLVEKGQTLYMHCYAAHGLGAPHAFHHAVRVYYW